MPTVLLTQSRLASRLRSLLAVALLVIGSPALLAAPVPGLYDVTVGVESQSPDIRSDVASEALLTMLTRLSGLRSIPRNAAVQAALKNPERYYSRFGYLAGDRDYPTYLTVSFSADAVTRLAREAKLPIWGANRPKIAIWSALSDGIDRSLIGADSESELAKALVKAAERRGLPIALPLLDLADMGQVSPAVVWGGLTDVIEPASQRYDADGFATGRIELRGDGSLSGTWRYTIGTGVDASTGRARATGDAQTVADALVDGVADALAARFAVLGRSLRVVQARVMGVSDARDYGELLRYLNKHEAFEAVGLQVVEPGSLRFGLATRSGDEQLLDLLALDGLLEPSGTGFDGSVEFTWRGDER